MRQGNPWLEPSGPIAYVHRLQGERVLQGAPVIAALLACAVFVAGVALDWVNAIYVMAVQELRAHRAGLCSVGLYMIGCVGFYSITQISWWFALPEGLGLYVGTRVAIAQRKRRACV